MQNYVQNGTTSYINNAKPQVQTQTNPQVTPSYSGVHISIINPMVNPGTGSVIYPVQTSSAYDSGTQGGCYPSTYYTSQPGVIVNPHPKTTNSGNNSAPAGFYDATGKYHPYVNQGGQTGYIDDNGKFVPLNTVQAPNGTGISKNQDDNGVASGTSVVQDGINGQGSTVNSQGQTIPNGFVDKDGKFRPYVKDANGQIGYYDDKGVFHPVDPNNNPDAVNGHGQTIPNGFVDKDGKFRPYVKDANGQIGYYDDKGVFHPVDPNNNPDALKDWDIQNKTVNNEINSKETVKSTESSESQKTAKKQIVALDDDYIKTLENYLNSQDTEVRKMGAKEVTDRLIEDPSRNDNPALTALVNKMLQDPASGIRGVALSLLESRAIQGDNLTVKLLKDMQNADSGYGMDSTQATSALLKMAGKVKEKEVPVTETKQAKEGK